MKQNNTQMKNYLQIDIFNLCDNSEENKILKKQSVHSGSCELFIGFLENILYTFTKRYIEKISGHHITSGVSEWSKSSSCFIKNLFT